MRGRSGVSGTAALIFKKIGRGHFYSNGGGGDFSGPFGVIKGRRGGKGRGWGGRTGKGNGMVW